MTVNRASTIPALFHSRVQATPNGVALQQFDAAKGSVSDRVTWSMWRDASTDVAGALISSGAHRGETVAVLAHNTTLWPDFTFRFRKLTRSLDRENYVGTPEVAA